MAEEQGAKSFWQTIPGVLAGLATVLTAVTGLVVALNQAGFFERSPPPTPPRSASTPARPTSALEPPVASAARPPVSREPIANPSGAVVTNDDALTGVWLNNLISSRNGQPESRLVITRLPNGTRILQGWGNCEPGQCDWGTAPLEVVAGNATTNLNGLRARTKLVHVVPSKNREDVTDLTLEGSGAPDSLMVRRKYEAYVSGQLTAQIEKVAVYTRQAARRD
jgi:hypothetical protein